MIQTDAKKMEGLSYEWHNCLGLIGSKSSENVDQIFNFKDLMKRVLLLLKNREIEKNNFWVMFDLFLQKARPEAITKFYLNNNVLLHYIQYK